MAPSATSASAASASASAAAAPEAAPEAAPAAEAPAAAPSDRFVNSETEYWKSEYRAVKKQLEEQKENNAKGELTIADIVGHGVDDRAVKGVKTQAGLFDQWDARPRLSETQQAEILANVKKIYGKTPEGRVRIVEDLRKNVENLEKGANTKPEDLEAAKEELYIAENLEKILDTKLDSASGEWLRGHGFINFEYTPRQKIQGLVNAGIVKPLKGIGVLANFGKGLLDTVSAFKSTLQGLGIMAEDQQYKEIDINSQTKGVDTYENNAGAIAQRVKDRFSKESGENGGTKVYEGVLERISKELEEFRQRVRDRRKARQETAEANLSEYKAAQGIKNLV